MVSGIALGTDTRTEIEQGIEVGDRVEVEGRILADGTWLAEEIDLADDDRELPFEFRGRVESTAPWMVSGVRLTVDGRSKIEDLIAVGDRVKVKGRILPDGAWLAIEIERIDGELGLGCMQVTSLVVSVDASQVVLQDGATIRIDGVPTQGQIQARSVIVLSLCVDHEGQITVITIVVLYQMEPEVVVQPTRSAAAPSGANRCSE